MSATFATIHALIAAIPEGHVATYGQLAALAGHPKGARLVVWALHNNPPQLLLPCHRVVAKSGRLSPAEVFGEDVQRSLLEAEGITFRRDGTIDMPKHQWFPHANGGTC